MAKLGDIQEKEPQHVMLCGDPKVGKSTLASQLAEADFNIIWFSLDNGHSVLYKLSPEAQQRVELVRLPDTKDFPVAIATCLKVVTGAFCHICDNHGQINCAACTKEKDKATWTDVELRKLGSNSIVVFDHISQLSDSAHNLITKDKPDDFKEGYEEYRLHGSMMAKFLMAIQQAPWNSVCISHLLEVEMEDGRKKLVPQVGTTNFSRTVGKYFDHIVLCSVANRKHAYGSSTTYAINAVTGSRSDIAIEKLDKPSLAPFFQHTTAKPANLVRAQEVTQKLMASKIVTEAKEVLVELEALRDGLGDVSGGNGSSSEVTSLEAEVAAVEQEVTKVTAVATVYTPAVTPELTPAERAKAALARMKGNK